MKPIKHIAALAAAALMAGCGGGGNTPATETAALTVQGDVIKGAMANAKVSLYKPNAEGQKGDLLEKTTTDINGHYSATVNGYSGVMIMEATVVPNETKMYDEATGETIDPEPTFFMRASFSAEAGKTYSAQINPFTERATERAVQTPGGLTTTNVAQANQDVAASLPFNPLTTAPEFDANGNPKNKIAATLTALSQMARDSKDCPGNQAAKVDCVVKKLSKDGLIGDMNTDLKLYAGRITTTFDLGTFVLNEETPVQVPVQVQVPVASATPVSALAQAKAFIAMLRSNAKALGATELSLQKEFQAVAKDMTSHTAPIAKASIDALNLARLSVQFLNDEIENPTTTTTTITTTRTLGSGESCTYQSATPKSVTCKNSTNGVVTQLTQETGTNTNTNTFKMTTGQATSATPTMTELATLTTTRASTTGPVTSVKLVGVLSSTDTASKYQVDLSAALSKLGDLEKLAVSGSIDLINSTTLKSIERIELADGSYLKANLVNNSYSAQDGSQEMLLKLKASTAASAVTGDVKLSAFKLDFSKTSYIPTLVSFAGSVQRNGVSFFDGTLTGEALNHAAFNSSLPRSATNAQKMRVGFTGKVNIPTRPVLNVQLFVVTKDTGSSATDTATLDGKFSQDAFVINLDGKTSATSNILTLESSEGIKLVIDSSAAKHPLTKNGDSLGEFSTSNSRVEYKDHSYEQY